MISGDSDDGDTDATRPRHIDRATAPWGVLVEMVLVGLIMVIVNGQVDDVALLDDDHQRGDNMEDNHNDATGLRRFL